MLNIKIKRNSKSATIPLRAFPTDAGADLIASSYIKIKPFEIKLVETDICMAIPPGYYGHICDKSGNALKRGLHVMGGVIDSAYRSSIGVVLVNLNMVQHLHNLLYMIKNEKPSFPLSVAGEVEIPPGFKVAQIIFKQCFNAKWEEVESLDETDRNLGSFGSTGTNI